MIKLKFHQKQKLERIKMEEHSQKNKQLSKELMSQQKAEQTKPIKASKEILKIHPISVRKNYKKQFLYNFVKIIDDYYSAFFDYKLFNYLQ